jgi:hypothetical protein
VGTFSLWHWIIFAAFILIPIVLGRKLLRIIRDDPRPILRRTVLTIVTLAATLAIVGNLVSPDGFVGSPEERLGFLIGSGIGGGILGIVLAFLVAIVLRRTADSEIHQATPPPNRPDSPSDASSYFYRHWRGHLSLPVSYWVNCFAVSALLAILVLTVISGLDFTESFRISALVIIFIWLVVSAVPVWQIVGTWRSATQYSQAHPQKYWGGATKFVLVLGALGSLNTLITTAGPQIAEYWRIASGSDPFGTYTLRVLRDSTEFEISGPLGFGISKAVSDQLRLYPSVKLIHLNSQGGRILEARNLAELIQERGLATYTATGCYSACVIAYAAGTERLIASQAKLGFHQYDFPGLRADPERSESC